MNSNIYENDMRKLNSEEQIAYYYWYVLDKIEKELELRGKDDHLILYTIHAYPAINDPYIPNSLAEQKIVKKLIESGVMEEVAEKTDFQIGGDEYSNPDSAGTQYSLKINQPVFNEIFEKYREIINRYEVAEEKGNTLTFNVNGEVSYISPTGEKYEAKLNINTNSYKLLSYLVQHPKEKHEFSTLEKELNEPRAHSRGPLPHRRVRDTVDSIKEALNYRGDDLIVCDYGFEINPDCTVHIIS